jgi:hypothetical protein
MWLEEADCLVPALQLARDDARNVFYFEYD